MLFHFPVLGGNPDVLTESMLRLSDFSRLIITPRYFIDCTNGIDASGTWWHIGGVRCGRSLVQITLAATQGLWASPSLVAARMTSCGTLCGCLSAKFDSCNHLLSSVHTLLVNILWCVRLYIKRKCYYYHPVMEQLRIYPICLQQCNRIRRD